MTKQIKHHFTKTVDDYDTVSEKVVYHNDKLHDVMIESITADTDAPLRVLDLGCGTGHGMRVLLEAYPNATIVGVDFSTKMLEKAKKHLKNHLDRCELIEEDIREFDFQTEEYDVIVSAVTIHNITHEEKEDLFAKIYGALKSGGEFINGDFFMGDTFAIQERLNNNYREYLTKNLEGEELEVWIEHAFEQDMPMKKSEQYLILTSIGFPTPLEVWEHENQIVYRCTK